MYSFTVYSLIMRIHLLEQHGFTQQKAYCSLLILIMRISKYALLIRITNNRQYKTDTFHPRLTPQICRVMEFIKLFRDYYGHMTC